MLLLPAIDLMNGQVVRLQQGKADQKTVYSDDPAAVARRWQEEGGNYLHIVDLDAAFSGYSGPANQAALKTILEALTIPCELGGGLRDEETVRHALDLGVSRVVIGTRAAESIEFVRQLVKTFGSERVAVGIDAKDGKVAVKGWTESANRSALDLALEAQSAGVEVIIYTDIATDGMLAGPNYLELDALSGETGLSFDSQRGRIHR